jgi:hypothetical protein
LLQIVDELYPENTTLQQEIALNLTILRVYAVAAHNETPTASALATVLHSLRRTRRLNRE